MMAKDLARELYKAFRNQARRNRASTSGHDETREKIGDPQKFGDLLDELVVKREWRQGLAEGNIFTDWLEIVGADISMHATPISLLDGQLTIKASSSAWATQLKLIENELVKTISNSAPGALVEKLIILGPSAPSWKKGIRVVRNGRGPRDTYG